MMSAFTPPIAPTVASHVAGVRTKMPSGAHLPQSYCVDWLLDCLSAAVRPAVRAILVEKLNAVRHLSVVVASEFSETVDHVQLALQVDAVFDHLELDAAKREYPSAR